MKDILDIIQNWRIEAFSPHNDGWAQNGYRKNLIELKEYLNNIENLQFYIKNYQYLLLKLYNENF